jgi:hypothetical protein
MATLATNFVDTLALFDSRILDLSAAVGTSAGTQNGYGKQVPANERAEAWNTFAGRNSHWVGIIEDSVRGKRAGIEFNMDLLLGVHFD